MKLSNKYKRLINKYKRMLVENGFTVYEPIKYDTWFHYSKNGKFGYCQVSDGETYLSMPYKGSREVGLGIVYENTLDELELEDFEKALDIERYNYINLNEVKMYTSEEEFNKEALWYDYKKLTSQAK